MLKVQLLDPWDHPQPWVALCWLLQIQNIMESSIISIFFCGLSNQWEFQDPKMEVLYHIRPYFVGIFPYIGLT